MILAKFDNGCSEYYAECDNDLASDQKTVEALMGQLEDQMGEAPSLKYVTFYAADKLKLETEMRLVHD